MRDIMQNIWSKENEIDKWNTSREHQNGIWSNRVRPKLEEAYNRLEEFALGDEIDDTTSSSQSTNDTYRFVGIPLCVAPLGRTDIRDKNRTIFVDDNTRKGGQIHEQTIKDDNRMYGTVRPLGKHYSSGIAEGDDDDTLGYLSYSTPQSTTGRQSVVSGLTSVTFGPDGHFDESSWSYVGDQFKFAGDDDKRRQMNAEYRDSPPKRGNAGFEVMVPAAQMKQLFSNEKRNRSFRSKFRSAEGRDELQHDERRITFNESRDVASELLEHARITECMSTDPFYIPTHFDRLPRSSSRTYRELRDDANVIKCNELKGINGKRVTWATPRVRSSSNELDGTEEIDGVLLLQPKGKQPIYLVANMDENTSPSKLAKALADVLLAHSKPEEERRKEAYLRSMPIKSNLKLSNYTNKPQAESVGQNHVEKKTISVQKTQLVDEKDKSNLFSPINAPAPPRATTSIRSELKKDNRRKVQQQQEQISKRIYSPMRLPHIKTKNIEFEEKRKLRRDPKHSQSQTVKPNISQKSHRGTKKNDPKGGFFSFFKSPTKKGRLKEIDGAKREQHPYAAFSTPTSKKNQDSHDSYDNKISKSSRDRKCKNSELQSSSESTRQGNIVNIVATTTSKHNKSSRPCRHRKSKLAESSVTNVESSRVRRNDTKELFHPIVLLDNSFK